MLKNSIPFYKESLQHAKKIGMSLAGQVQTLDKTKKDSSI
jgi:hypothetical protein